MPCRGNHLLLCNFEKRQERIIMNENTQTDAVHDIVFDRISASFTRQRFLTLLGAELVSVENGRVVISCECRDALTQQNGFMHAGAITTLADVACGYAAMTTAPDRSNVMSVEYKMNLLRPMSGKTLSVVGTVLKSGRTLTVTRAEAFDADSGKLIAEMLGTMITVLEK